MSAGLTDRHPRAGRLSRWVGRAILFVGRWRIEGELPDEAKVVFVAAPHTSNWDGVLMLAIAWKLGVRLSWLGKESMFKRWPLGPMLRAFGGVAVDRSRRQDTVKTIAAQFATRDKLYLAIPPSGTRRFRDHWKSGFYYVALEADVPVVLAFLDYPRKTGGTLGSLRLTGDVVADMDRIRSAYQGVRGRFPDKQSTIRLHAEDPAEEPAPAGAEEPPPGASLG